MCKIAPEKAVPRPVTPEEPADAPAPQAQRPCRRSSAAGRDVCRHGVLAGDPGRYRLRLADALNPGECLPRDVAFRNHKGKSIRAVFLNYLLDCLSAAVLEIGAPGDIQGFRRRRPPESPQGPCPQAPPAASARRSAEDAGGLPSCMAARLPG
jgi:hypothetical protein